MRAAVGLLFVATAFAQDPARIIEKARQQALDYTATLPNFLCTETIHRSQAGPNSDEWIGRDTLTLDVGYSKKGEVYKLLTINGKPTNKKLASIGGFKSTGEFGTLLKRIFIPEAMAEFHREPDEELRGRPAYVFSYRIAQRNSTYGFDIYVRRKRYRARTGMRGMVWIDRETFQVMRFSDEADGIPPKWPILSTPAVLDYAYADIGGQQFLLPQSVDSRVVQDDMKSRNTIEFHNYRKFSSEATLTFEK